MGKTKIKPGPHRLLIIPHDKQTEKHGLIIPTQSRDWGQIGVVKAIGDGVTFCKEGDTVIYGNYLGIEITYEGQVYIMLYERELYGLVEEETVFNKMNFTHNNVDMSIHINTDEETFNKHWHSAHHQASIELGIKPGNIIDGLMRYYTSIGFKVR